MRRLSVFALLVCLFVTSCRPRDNIRVEMPQPENLSASVNVADPTVSAQLIRGFHNVEQGSWRWTQGTFSVLLKGQPGSKKGGSVVLRCTVAEPLIAHAKTVTLTAKISGGVVGSQTWTKAGEYTFSAPIPAAQLDTEAITVDFSLDKFLPEGKADSRELGLIVSSIAVETNS